MCLVLLVKEFFKNKKILVVASHPDDEVLGCGGTLIKYSKDGYEIKIIFIGVRQ